MKRTAFFLTVFLSLAIAVSAQMPTPAPEVKKLDYFAGNWTSEGNVKAGAWGPGGKFTYTEHDEWMDGSFFLVGHASYKMPTEMGGNLTQLSVMGYDTSEKVYTYTGFNSAGERTVYKGSLDGDTWTWNSTENLRGTPMKGRFTMKVLSPASFSMKFEMSPDGTNWTTFMEATATRAK